MRQPLIALLLGMAGVLADVPAQAHATATVTVNGGSYTLSQTGFVFEAIERVDVVLGSGQSGDFTFNYSISVQDDGLPTALDRLATGCVSLHLQSCSPPYSGFEVVKAELIALYLDPRIIPPFIEITGDRTVVELQTQSDSFADSLTWQLFVPSSRLFRSCIAFAREFSTQMLQETPPPQRSARRSPPPTPRDPCPPSPESPPCPPPPTR